MPFGRVFLVMSSRISFILTVLTVSGVYRWRKEHRKRFGLKSFFMQFIRGGMAHRGLLCRHGRVVL